jgi:hypothetical protein
MKHGLPDTLWFKLMLPAKLVCLSSLVSPTWSLTEEPETRQFITLALGADLAIAWASKTLGVNPRRA